MKNGYVNLRNMKLDEIANSGNDEFYTPACAIEPIVKYIKPDWKIWCPFDTEESLFVKKFKGLGHDVIYTHIKKGQDSFKMEVPECDCIISNPPFSSVYICSGLLPKQIVFERVNKS